MHSVAARQDKMNVLLIVVQQIVEHLVCAVRLLQSKFDWCSLVTALLPAKSNNQYTEQGKRLMLEFPTHAWLAGLKLISLLRPASLPCAAAWCQIKRPVPLLSPRCCCCSCAKDRGESASYSLHTHAQDQATQSFCTENKTKSKPLEKRNTAKKDESNTPEGTGGSGLHSLPNSVQELNDP